MSYFKRMASFIHSLGAAMVILIALTTASCTGTGNPTITRIGGLDRYESAVEISKMGWAHSSDTAIIATGQDFPDALTAAPLAKKYNAPVLLTERNSIPQAVINELIRLKVKTAYIVGGDKAVSPSVENQLTSMNITSIRLAGANRFDTAVIIAEKVGINSGEIAVVNGYEFAEALCVSPIAASKGMPILLTDKRMVPDCVSKYLEGKNITRSYLLGGEDLIDSSVMSKLANPERITGNSKYERNINIINKFESSINFSNVYLATARDFPDALAVSAAASKTSSPLILVDDKNITEALEAFLLKKRPRINRFNVIGLQGAVSDRAVDILCNGEVDYNTNYTLDDVKKMDLSLIAKDYVLFIELGIPDSEPMLIKSLERYGSSKMAVDFLNCGNDKLEQAARSWAAAHGYQVITVTGGVNSPRWGKK